MTHVVYIFLVLLFSFFFSFLFFLHTLSMCLCRGVPEFLYYKSTQPYPWVGVLCIVMENFLKTSFYNGSEKYFLHIDLNDASGINHLLLIQFRLQKQYPN